MDKGATVKKFLNIFILLAAYSAFGQMQAIVSETGKLQYPTPVDFVLANFSIRFIIDTTPTISIATPTTTQSATTSFTKPYYVNANGTRIATTSSSGGNLSTSITYYRIKPNVLSWSDCELKAIRKSDGELVYWVSTQAGKTSTEYFDHAARDAEANIFYTLAGSANDGRNWIERNDHTSNSNYAHASSHTNGSVIIGGIVIEPDLTNPQVATIFKNPELYYFVFIKIDPVGGLEKDTNGNPIWRPIIPILTPKN